MTNQTERQLTEATIASTGHFWCTSSAHFVPGKPVMINNRRVCKACADKRKQRLKEPLR